MRNVALFGGLRRDRPRRVLAVPLAIALLGSSVAALAFRASAGATQLGECESPFYIGLWTGTWASSTPSGPSGSSGQQYASGTWSADLEDASFTLEPELSTYSDRFSMTQTFPPGLPPFFTNTAGGGSVFCDDGSGQVRVDIGGGGDGNPDASFQGVLSADGSQYIGHFALYDAQGTQTGAGTFQGSLPEPTKRAAVNVLCLNTQLCDGKLQTPGSAHYPAQTTELIRKSTGPVQDLVLKVAAATLACPHATPTLAPVASEADTFPKGTPLTAKLTLQSVKQFTGWKVCYGSKKPFKSASSPKVAKAGTAVLLTCTQSKNATPCVNSETRHGNQVLITATIPNNATGTANARFSVVR